MILLQGLGQVEPIFCTLLGTHFVLRSRKNSIIGDRGKGDTPNSTGGVVAY